MRPGTEMAVVPGMTTMQHEMTMTTEHAFVGGRTRRYYRASCSCGCFRSDMESSRMHAVEAHRRHVADVERQEGRS